MWTRPTHTLLSIVPEWGVAGLKIGKEKERETHFWKGVKALYRRNLIQLFEEGHALVIMAVLICKVYEVWLVHAPGVKRGSGESGKRQKGEVGSDLGILEPVVTERRVTYRDAGSCCGCRKPRARGFCPKRLHMHGTSIHNRDISKSTRIHLSIPLVQLSGDMTCISIVTKFKLSNLIIHSANLFSKNRQGVLAYSQPT